MAEKVWYPELKAILNSRMIPASVRIVEVNRLVDGPVDWEVILRVQGKIAEVRVTGKSEDGWWFPVKEILTKINLIASL